MIPLDYTGASHVALSSGSAVAWEVYTHGYICLGFRGLKFRVSVTTYILHVQSWHLCACVHVGACVYVQTQCVCRCMYMRIHINRYTHVHIYIYMYTHKRIDPHAPYAKCLVDVFLPGVAQQNVFADCCTRIHLHGRKIGCTAIEADSISTVVSL